MDLNKQVLDLLEQLEATLENSKKAIFTAQYLVDKEELMYLVGAVRDALPAEYTECIRIIDKEHSILHNANRYAENQMAEAEDQARNIVQDAQDQAENVLREARRRAEERELESQKQADLLMEATQRKVEDMVQTNSIVKRAEQKAHETLAAARGEAQRIRLMNLDHCETMLKQVEDKAIEVANLVRANRNQLSEER